MVSQRALSEGATGLNFGEIIGYSSNQTALMTDWINSPTHNSVILDKQWNWIGIGEIVLGKQIVSVINFSSGNLGSTSYVKYENHVVFEGTYITIPEFKGNFKIITLNTYKNRFILEIEPNKNPIFIYGYNSVGDYEDRADIFF